MHLALAIKDFAAYRMAGIFLTAKAPADELFYTILDVDKLNPSLFYMICRTQIVLDI
jgi:hypothetical protein